MGGGRYDKALPDVHRGGEWQMNFVYILQSQKNNQYYIGSTANLLRRIAEHNSGKTKSLKYLLPVVLVFKQEFTKLSFT
ncbi:MAG: GIY-YIG nuclease family protein [Bacteroidota bacterium]